MIHSALHTPPQNTTAVVLGCSVKGTKPSRILEERIDAAYDYLSVNKDAVCILSGGRGPGEDITEAQCMYEVLTKRGISENRLILEERSTTTEENLKYTGEILKTLDPADIRVNSSIDVYQNPKNKKEEIFISYPTYDQYVSREFADKEKVMKDREVASTRCPVCHMPAKRRIRWFMNNSRAYESVSLCQKHGYIKGKVRIRHTDEDAYYAIKKLKRIEEKDAEEIREKRDSLRKKRQAKRQSEKLV